MRTPAAVPLARAAVMTASACMAVLSGRSLFLRARLPAAGLDAGATGRASSASLGASGSVALFALVLLAVSSVGSLASSDEPAVPSSLMLQFNRIVNKGLDDLRQFAVAAFGDFGAEHGAQGEVLQFGHGTSAGLQIGDGLPCDS